MNPIFRLMLLVATALLLGACVTPLPPSPQDIAAKRFEAVPGQAVIYLVRDDPDFSRDGATVMLDGNMMGTTYPGTYFRWNLAPGPHRIAGFAGDAGSLAITVAADRLYFIQQLVGREIFLVPQSYFQPIDAAHGRAAVLRSVLVGTQ